MVCIKILLKQTNCYVGCDREGKGIFLVFRNVNIIISVVNYK